MVEWPEPKSRKDLQKFLGFANFYRHFIHNFSNIALPLTNLTSPKLQFQWSPGAQQAFALLKRLFSSAPVLVQADLDPPFLVEVGALDSSHSRWKVKCTHVPFSRFVIRRTEL